MVTAVGLVAAVFTTVAFMPQVLRIWRTRSARDISGLGTSLFSIGVALWVVYGVAIHSLPVILANSVTLALNLSILALKSVHDSRDLP
jgi:MtN3 and saliva related transmembrane protein